MAIDWSDGDYGATATLLAPVAAIVVGRAGVTQGEDVLDIGVGTGNAVVEAARRGARVSGVDPAAGLLAIARNRCQDEGITATLVEGVAEALPFPDATFHRAVSVFAVIFSPDPPAAIAELARVVRPGGTITLSSWIPQGALFEVGALLGEAMGQPSAPGPRWGDPGWIRTVLAGAGLVDVAIDEHTLVIEDVSPEADFAALEADHPVWRAGRRAIDESRWARLREDSISAIRAHNEDPSALRITSRYLVTHARR